MYRSATPGSQLRSETTRMLPVVVAVPTGGYGSLIARHGPTIDVTPQPSVLGCNLHTTATPAL